MCTLKLVAKKFLEDKISTNSSTLSSFAATLVGNKKVVVNSHRRESAAESVRDTSHFNPGGRKTGAMGSRSGSLFEDLPPPPTSTPDSHVAPVKHRQKSEVQFVDTISEEEEDEDD